MTGNVKHTRIIVVLVFLLLPFLIYLFVSKITPSQFSVEAPRYYGPLTIDTIETETGSALDTQHYKVPDFTFQGHTGDTVTEADFEGHIYITDFFFTTCPGICPILTSQLTRVQKAFKDQDVKILSHTVDPERDSIEALAAYAEQHDADPEMWYFVTGTKEALYEQARHGYFLVASDEEGGDEEFIHSNKLILVDKNRHLRGYYNGTDSSEVDQLLDDIRYLIMQEKVYHRP